jgi:hypothetical protein
VHITKDSDGSVALDTSFPSITATPSTYTWSSTDTGVFTIYWEIENNRGCISSLSTKYTRTTSLPCQLAASGATLTPASGSPKTNILTLNLNNTYTKSLDINQITVSWTNPSTHTMTRVDLPTSPLTAFCGPGTFASGAATCKPAFLPPTILAGATSGTKNTWSTSVAGETITLKYDFTDSTGLAGTCTFCVSPAQAITVSTSGTCP